MDFTPPLAPSSTKANPSQPRKLTYPPFYFDTYKIEGCKARLCDQHLLVTDCSTVQYSTLLQSALDYPLGPVSTVLREIFLYDNINHGLRILYCNPYCFRDGLTILKWYLQTIYMFWEPTKNKRELFLYDNINPLSIYLSIHLSIYLYPEAVSPYSGGRPRSDDPGF